MERTMTRIFFWMIVLVPTTLAVGWKGSGKGGAVAAGNGRAVSAGISILEQDGNAADAAAATLLALSITDFGSFCIGGEAPFMYADSKTGKVTVLAGQGVAPQLATVENFEKTGIPRAFRPNNLANAAVPAIIDLCVTALREYGSMRFEQVVAPSLAILKRGGNGWYPDLARTFERLVEAERAHPDERIAGLQAVADRFYRGDIADELDAWYRANGGLIRKVDLAAHVTHIEEPLSIDYHGYTVYKCGVWTQGPFMLQTLRLLESHDLKAMGHLSADYIHVVAEAMKLAFADRDTYYADPRMIEVPLDALLSAEYAKLRAPLINPQKASRLIRPGDPINMKALMQPDAESAESAADDQDTTTCLVADRWGNVVACTPSGWGSTAGAGGLTGITHGTRLISLNNWPGHPNAIAPGKRPRITLTPTLVFKDGKPLLAISVVGGDLQDQVGLQLLLDALEFDMSPAEAVTAPRFSTAHHVNSFSQTPPKKGSLTLYPVIREEVRAALGSRGHRVGTKKGVIGLPCMLRIDPDGTLHAAGDPRAGRHAAALP
ncbi:MAG: gamma-glutamyltranspeptidase/glutathione hydrolase [Rhodothermales bacterium]|jgi:gamma-glutamyltranspeptidase/glutathione hydrolase